MFSKETLMCQNLFFFKLRDASLINDITGQFCHCFIFCSISRWTIKRTSGIYFQIFMGGPVSPSLKRKSEKGCLSVHTIFLRIQLPTIDLTVNTNATQEYLKVRRLSPQATLYQLIAMCGFGQVTVS